MSGYDELDKYRVEEFLVRVQQFANHSKAKKPEALHCESCQWTQRKLEVLQGNMAKYSEERKEDDDKVDWDLLILEVLADEVQEHVDQEEGEEKKEKANQEEEPVESGSHSLQGVENFPEETSAEVCAEETISSEKL